MLDADVDLCLLSLHIHIQLDASLGGANQSDTFMIRTLVDLIGNIRSAIDTLLLQFRNNNNKKDIMHTMAAS